MSEPIRIKNIIIGTAGHVDHGKTTLLRALTGIDADRLKEEKERGMTIDLGFAWLKLPSDEIVGIVDVPGHERFLKNMLAGATGIDVALLVVAADEGIMPQTREHLDILRILDTKRGVVALTKVDLVEKDWLDIVEEELRDQLRGSFLENAPIIPVSGETGYGMDMLYAALVKLCEESSAETKPITGGFRLPIDRVFTLTGFGTVVTGTLASGTIQINDDMEILPRGLRTRVRHLQVHGGKVEQVLAGTRVAVNVAGIEVSEIQRGDVCATPGSMKPTLLVDVRITILPNSPIPLENRSRIRFHVGTAEVIGRITLLDAERLRPGESAFAQFRAEKPLVAARGDRFVIRSYSPMHTIGGGVVLDILGRKRRSGDAEAVRALQARFEGSPKDIAADILHREGCVSISTLAHFANWTEDIAEKALSALSQDGTAALLPNGFFADSVAYTILRDRITQVLKDYHEKQPSLSGMPKEALNRVCLSEADKKLFFPTLAMLQKEGRIAIDGNLTRLAEHTPKLSEKQQSLAEDIAARFQSAKFTPPTEKELLESIPDAPAREALQWLLSTGELVKIDEGLYLHRDALANAESLIRDYLSKHPNITVSQFRDLIGSSRKFVVPLLEYFDSKRVTRRVGDARVLLGQRGKE